MNLIYLHGFASSPASRKARFFRERFAAAGIEIAIPDLAEGDFENLTVTGQLRVIERLAAGRPATLMGSSMGGYLAALYAARHPEVERVVLMAPAFDFPRRWVETIGEAEAARWRDSGYLAVRHHGEDAGARVGWGLIEDARRYEGYPDVRQPALVFHGRNDDVVPAEASEEFARRHPGTLLHIVESGHDLGDVTEFMWTQTSRFLL